jgi:hypothetical protein
MSAVATGFRKRKKERRERKNGSGDEIINLRSRRSAFSQAEAGLKSVAGEISQAADPFFFIGMCYHHNGFNIALKFSGQRLFYYI